MFPGEGEIRADLLVRLSFLISEERFTDSSKLIDVNGIVPRIDPAVRPWRSHK